MDVQIKLTGLLLLAERDGLLYVVAPSSHVHGPGNGNGHPPTVPIAHHHPEIKYPGSVGWLSLDQTELDLSANLTCTPGTTQIPSEVLDVGSLVGQQKLDKDQWGKRRRCRSSVVARMILPKPTNYIKPESVQWRVEVDDVVFMRPQLVHEITLDLANATVDNGFLAYNLQDFTQQDKLPDLAPPDGSGGPRLIEIRNVPRWEKPLAQDEEALHFRAYPPVFPVASAKTPRIFLDEAPQRALTAYTCMLGQG
ncbi:MAG TPA: hypothetical protein VF665_19920 [Longimicrobium sp.]|jgi:hypothetical protein|uniref:hypothetical protein n=1 Tax=Longimicrobium sp. TaxID=2029185 RepID=UPI002ED9AC77